MSNTSIDHANTGPVACNPTETIFTPSGHCRRCDGFAEHFAHCPLVVHIGCTCTSPIGCFVHGPQPREHAVTCWCGTSTWNVDGLCDRHLHPDRCPTCNGSGQVWHPRWGASDCPDPTVTCPDCAGTGTATTPEGNADR